MMNNLCRELYPPDVENLCNCKNGECPLFKLVEKALDRAIAQRQKAWR